MQRESAASRRPQWRKKPEPPLGAEVSVGPGAGVAVSREFGLAGADSSTASLGFAQRGGPGEKGASLHCPGKPLILTALGPAGVRSQSQASSHGGHLSRPLPALDPGGHWPASSPPLWSRQACPVPWPAVGTARLHTALPPCLRGLLFFLFLRGRRVAPVSLCTSPRLAPTVPAPPARLEELCRPLPGPASLPFMPHLLL